MLFIFAMITKKRLLSLAQNKDVRTLSENFISLAFLKVASYVFPLITLPYLSRVIGVDSFGEIAFATSVIIYFETITDFGFDYTSTRDVAKNRENKELISRIFSNVFFSKVMLMVFCIIIFSILVISIPFLYEKRLLLWLTFLYIPGHILFPGWFFQAMEKMKYITILNLFSKLIFTVLVFIVIREKSDYVFQPVLISLGYLLSGFISLWIIFRKFGIRMMWTSFKEIWISIKSNWNMFLSLFLPNLYSNLSIILLRIYGGGVAAGIYSGGFRFVHLFSQLSAILSRTFYPFLARRMDKHSLYVKIAGAINIIMSLTLFFGADLLIKIFLTEEFTESAIVIRIMAISILFLFLYQTFGTNYLVLIGKENILKNIIALGSIFGLIISVIVVLRYNFIGVAITITVVRFLMGIATWYYAYRFKK